MAKNNLTFTKAGIDRLPIPASGQRVTYYDTKTNGLQLRVSSTGIKTFCVYRWVKGVSKPERITLGRYPDMTIEQARTMAASINAAIAQGENPADRDRARRAEMTLQELFADYLEHRRSIRGGFLKEKTKREYRLAFNLYLCDRNRGANLADKRLSAITHETIAALHTKIGREHPIMANRLLAVLTGLFTHAKKRGLYRQENPAKSIDKFPEKTRDRFLQADELPRFFQALAEEPNDTIRDYFLVSLLTGARRSNVLAMRWEDINFERAEWRIPETKNGTPQTVTLSPEALQILVGRKPPENTGYVFPGTGRRGHLVEPKAGWKRILKRADITELRIHDLRRTLGSWQAKTGASLAIIGKSLNHKSPSTTAIYARLDLDPVRESVGRATSAILAAAGLKDKADVVKLRTGSEDT